MKPSTNFTRPQTNQSMVHLSIGKTAGLKLSGQLPTIVSRTSLAFREANQSATIKTQSSTWSTEQKLLLCMAVAFRSPLGVYTLLMLPISNQVCLQN